jgi:hypothetical protein
VAERPAPLDQLSPDARQLAVSALEVVDTWWDDDAALLWNPPGSFDEVLEPRSVHMVPQTAWYVAGLLLRSAPGDVERATRAVRRLVALQYDAPGTVWHGTYARFAEWPEPTDGAVEWADYDPNWREFIGTTFAVVLHLLSTELPADVVALLEGSIALAQRGEPEGRIPEHYANIALMKAWLDADTGRRTNDRALVDVGESFAERVVERFLRHGAFDEYGSPTYYGIDLYALALWRDLSPTQRFAEWAEQVEAALWRDVAEWYHPGLRNLCGPYTRAYGMDMGSYAALLGLWMQPALGDDAPFPALGSGIEHVHDLAMAPMAALLGPNVPDDVVSSLRELRGEHVVTKVISDDPRRVATGWLAPDVMIGAEDNAGGWSGYRQYHPATIHWRLPGGGVGTIRAVHRGPLRATAAPGELRLRVDDHAHVGAQPTVFQVAAGADSGTIDLTPSRWTLPGLTVEVDGPTEGVEVSEDEVVWPAGPVELRLHVRTDDRGRSL